MDIFIKSFNRVYYLDRCLKSIKTYLRNEGQIYILDDGTPKEYLEAISLKYRKVKILKSDDYNLKSSLLENKNYKLPERIPAGFWFESVKNASEYVIILEDDMWFKNEVDIQEIQKEFAKERLGLLKLFWLGNKELIKASVEKQSDNLIFYKPKLKFNSPIIFNYVFNTYHPTWRKLMTLIGFYSRDYELNYYGIYSVAGAIFKKDYYLNIWNNATKGVDEKQQLINALVFYRNNKLTFGRTKNEVLKTGFLSSAFPKKKYNEFSVHDFNCTLNEHWLENENFYLDKLDFDLDKEKIKTILKSKGKSLAYIEEWESWVNLFKQSYKDIGCNI